GHVRDRARATPPSRRRGQRPRRSPSRGRGAAVLRGAQRERNRRSARLPAGHGEISTLARTRPTADHARRGGDVVIDLEVALTDLVDHRVPGGLVTLTYERFTLVEIATNPTEPPPLTKLVSASTPVQHVTVRGRPGLWIAEPHVIAYVDRSGRFVSDTMRKSGPVLL